MSSKIETPIVIITPTIMNCKMTEIPRRFNIGFDLLDMRVKIEANRFLLRRVPIPLMLSRFGLLKGL